MILLLFMNGNQDFSELTDSPGARLLFFFVANFCFSWHRLLCHSIQLLEHYLADGATNQPLHAFVGVFTNKASIRVVPALRYCCWLKH